MRSWSTAQTNPTQNPKEADQKLQNTQDSFKGRKTKKKLLSLAVRKENGFVERKRKKKKNGRSFVEEKETEKKMEVKK